jgi:hypothetical protein
MRTADGFSVGRHYSCLASSAGVQAKKASDLAFTRSVLTTVIPGPNEWPDLLQRTLFVFAAGRKAYKTAEPCGNSWKAVSRFRSRQPEKIELQH